MEAKILTHFFLMSKIEATAGITITENELKFAQKIIGKKSKLGQNAR